MILLKILFVIAILFTIASKAIAQPLVNNVQAADTSLITRWTVFGSNDTIVWQKGKTWYKFLQKDVYLTQHTATRNNGAPSSIAWFDGNGRFMRSPLDSIKRVKYTDTSLMLAPYMKTAVALATFLTSVPPQSFASITGKPTTLSGYGITDAYPLSGNPSGFLTGITSGQVTTALGLTPVSQAGARSAISLTTTGTSGSATYNSSTGVLNVPQYGGGTVTSVGITSTDFTISGSPITTSGNITANLNTSGVTAGTYGNVTVTNKGIVTAGKRQVPYTSTTNSSGEDTVTFSSSYSIVPNVQAQIIKGTSNQVVMVTQLSTTGFRVKVVQRNSVNLLGIDVLLSATSNVNGATVHALVTEN